MKRSAILVPLLVLMLAAPAIASEAFTLDIPLRGNAQQETGEVRVTLTLSAAPAGAQLVVNGAATLNLGDTQTVSGDQVSFTTVSGNDVRIVYRPLSNFAPNDFCQGGFAQPKSIPMRFSGPQDVVSYRISSYLVASPTVECSQPSKHTGDTPATLTPADDGVAPQLDAINLGRHPFDVVLVLDKSGSMQEFPPGAISGAVKATILHSAVQAFVAAWRDMDAAIPGGGEWSHDRIGMTFFNQASNPRTFPSGDPPANFFVERGADGSAWNDIIGDIGNLSPGGSTSVGGGINDAMAKWKSDPQNDLSLVLVTDGKQNTAPLIADAGNGHLGLDPVAGLPQELRKRFIPIQTIGFGTPAGVDLALLTNISFETNGDSFISVNATTMFDNFAWTLIAILKGNTAAMALQQHETMTGQGPGALKPLLVDASTRRAVFLLQWAPPLRNALDLEVLRPGGNAAAPRSNTKLPQAVIQTFDIGKGDTGTWSFRVKRGGPSHLEDVPYTLNVLFLEQHLDYRISFDTVHTGTGDQIGVRAVVAWDGKPLAHLPPNAIRVRIQRPNEALGTILHNSTADAGSGTTTTPTGDVKTPYDRKLDAITDGKLLDRLLPRDVDTITLTDQGKGVYAGSFAGTSVPGSYGFEVVLDWDDPRTGHLHRQERLEDTVKVKPDQSKSDFVTTRGPNGSVYVSVTPRDRFGNYLGPGYSSLLKATLTGGGRLSGPVDANQTGTYVYTVNDLPPGLSLSPQLDIVVDGVSFGSAPPLPISGGGTSSSSGKWLFFADLGPNFPHGSFSNGTDGKWSLNAGFERQLSALWSFEAIAGYHRFEVPVIANPHIVQLSAGGKRYFGKRYLGTWPWRPFVNASIGAYRFDPGDRTKAGAELGAGVLYDLSSKVALEGLWNYHTIHASPNANFSTLQFGLRFAF